MSNIISQSIHTKHYLSFTYKGLSRVVQPHTYGLFSNNVDMLVAYQTDGVRDKGEMPGWGNYRVNDIYGASILHETFLIPQSRYKRNDSRFRAIYSQL